MQKTHLKKNKIFKTNFLKCPQYRKYHKYHKYHNYSKIIFIFLTAINLFAPTIILSQLQSNTNLNNNINITTNYGYRSYRQMNTNSIITANTSGDDYNWNIMQSAQPTFVRCVLIENHSISILRPQLVFNITTDAPINIILQYAGISVSGEGLSNSEEKIIPTIIQNIILPAGSNILRVNINLRLDAFPGKYFYALYIFFLNTSGTPSNQPIYIIDPGSFYVFSGPLILISIISTIIVGISIITVRTEKVKKEKIVVAASSAQVYVTGASSSGGESNIPVEVEGQNLEEKTPGKIKCPNCKKEIEEGTAFCPYCGYHLPKFLRESN
ncbi:MAG: zinc ribbon domain-containing protein [Promethearchaeota archaeon]